MRSLLFVNKKKQKKFVNRGVAAGVTAIPRAARFDGSQAQLPWSKQVTKFFWFFFFTKRTRISLPSTQLS